MSITASEARRRLFPLIDEVNDDHQAVVEIVSKKGTAFLVSADEYRSLKETVYLLQSPAPSYAPATSSRTSSPSEARLHPARPGGLLQLVR